MHIHVLPIQLFSESIFGQFEVLFAGSIGLKDVPHLFALDLSCVSINQTHMAPEHTIFWGAMS